MRDETIGDFLGQLAGRVPAPGGGAAAALQAALAAALLGMVARYTTGETYAEHAELIGRVIEEADELQAIALRLAEADAEAFAAVAVAYRLPRSTDAERAERSGAIATALVGAAWPPARLIGVAGLIVDLAGALVQIGNRNVISDLAAAAEAARAAVATSRVNIEINLAAIEDAQASLDLIGDVDKAAAVIAKAEQIAATVREQIRA
jgi:methenyltetrahydrofolate cyclohydrolase